MTVSPTDQAAAPGIVVAIDGPAGAGKSTVALQLAKRLGFDFLDTGAMYRCVTLAVQRANLDPADLTAVAEILAQLEIEIDGTQVRLNGQDVSSEIRTPEVAKAIGTIADNLEVRRKLTQLQRHWTQGRQVVTEGRDQGSEVFHDAPCKFFLYASGEERAKRRQADLASRGISMTFDDVLEQQNQRDARDRARPVGALRKADDAIEFCTDGITLEQVIQSLEEIVRRKLDLGVSSWVANSTATSRSSASPSEPQR